jgi:hypothetical protein
VDDVRVVQGRHDLDFAVNQPPEIFVFGRFGIFRNGRFRFRSVRRLLPDEARFFDHLDGDEAPGNEERLGEVDPRKRSFALMLENFFFLGR